MSSIRRTTFKFLKDLSTHNNRDWFNAHKDDYLEAKTNVEEFVDALILKMNRHDRIETPSAKQSLYRIHNDVRFSKDKNPYNPRFAGYLRRSKPLLRGGYYFWIKPGGTRVACGFAYPSSDDLFRMRQDIEINYGDWRKLLHSKSMTNNFGEMKGDRVKTAPRGFDKEHLAIDLLRFKQYWFEHHFTDDEALSSEFLNHVNKVLKSIRPFFNYASDVLGTDLNGESRRS